MEQNRDKYSKSFIKRETKAENLNCTITDGFQHVNPSFMHSASTLKIFFKESQDLKQSAVILQDLNVVRHIPVHLIVLFSLGNRKMD